jgi:hypothetical protein
LRTTFDSVLADAVSGDALITKDGDDTVIAKTAYRDWLTR